MKGHRVRQKSVHARKSDRQFAGANNGGYQLLVYAPRNHLRDGVDDRFVRDPKAVYKAGRNATFFQEAGDLLPSAVDNEHFVFTCDVRELIGDGIPAVRLIQKRTPDFDEYLHNSASVSGNPSIRFMFWTACPAAPFIKLSSVAIIVRRCVSASNTKPMSQKFVRWTLCKSGTFPGAYRRTNGSLP